LPTPDLAAVLQIRPGQRVSLLGVRDAAFLRTHLPQVANPSQHRAAMQSDVIVLAIESKLQWQRLAPLRKYLAPEGIFWVLCEDESTARREFAAAGFAILSATEFELSLGRNEYVKKIAVCAQPLSSS
jgi:hypothetical protein